MGESLLIYWGRDGADEAVLRSSEFSGYCSLEAQLPVYWVPFLGSLYRPILPITQEPTIWVPRLLGVVERQVFGEEYPNYEMSQAHLETRLCLHKEEQSVYVPDN